MNHIKTITVSKAATDVVGTVTGFLEDAWQQVGQLLKKQPA